MNRPTQILPVRALVIALTAVFCALLSPGARASELALPDTQVHFLDSKSNGVQYKLYVSLPHGYADSGKKYPVLYLLDADYSFPIVRGIVHHLGDRHRLRELIVVGIAYGGPDQYRLNRTRDYTPHFVADGGYGPAYQKVSGGGPKFLQFLREELIPWTDRTFRTIPGERGLTGHSYGGLFATWVLVTAPDTFSHYIVVSPSLWYSKRFLFDVEKKRAAKPRAADPSARVYFAVGAREGNAQHDMVRDLRQMASVMRAKKTLAVKSEVFDDETHDSVFPTAVSRGIRFVFQGD